jgi:hypothetical protein
MKNIIRIEKRKKFTIINRDLLEDKRLHWATRGILGYLLSKPDNWILQVQDLKKQGDLGRDAIYNRIKNAIEHGYITRLDRRDNKGRVTGVEYIVHEESIYPLPENTDTVKQEADKPDTENTYINKDEVITKTKKETTTTTCGSGDYKFHKQLSKIQRSEITILLSGLEFELAQDVLYEVSGFIDKNLIQKDPVSLLQGMVKKAKGGEFSLRLGIKYKESAKRSIEIKKEHEINQSYAPQLNQADMSNPLVKKILNIQNRGEKCSV